MMIQVLLNKLYPTKEESNLLQYLCILNTKVYNSALYHKNNLYENDIKISEFELSTYIAKELKQDEHFQWLKKIPSKMIQNAVQNLYDNFTSYFEHLKVKEPDEIVSPPGFKEKNSCSNIQFYQNQFVIKEDIIRLGLTPILKKIFNLKCILIPYPERIKSKKIKRIDIIPEFNGKEFSIVYMYEEKEIEHDLNENNKLTIDLGIDNLASCLAIVNDEFDSFILDGKNIKKVNHEYNKSKSWLTSIYDKSNLKDKNTKKFIKLSNYRTFFIRDCFRQYVNFLLKYCLNNKIGIVVIGYNKEWKTECRMGKKNNQKFVSVPHRKFVDMLSNKLKFHGIKLIEQEESYTSKCSSLDLESIEKHEVYMGKRIRRGKFRSFSKVILNSDLNGALNILRKSVGSVLDEYLFNNMEKLKRYLCSPIRICKGEVLAKDCNFNSCSDQLWTFSKSLNALSS